MPLVSGTADKCIGPSNRGGPARVNPLEDGKTKVFLAAVSFATTDAATLFQITDNSRHRNNLAALWRLPFDGAQRGNKIALPRHAPSHT
jgi:hypothetical protein